MMSTKFQKTLCPNPYFIGDQVYCDLDFVPELNKLASFAADTGLLIYITNSLRSIGDTLTGTIVEPAKKSCHYVGHAIDMNLQDEETKEFFNSKRLKDFNSLPGNVQEFIGLIRLDEVLRWGGDFANNDVVHIDDNLWNRDQDLYLSKLKSREQE